MLYSRLRLAWRRVGSIRYVVERRAIGHARIRHGPARWPRRSLQPRLDPEAHVDVDEHPYVIERRIGPETNPLRMGRRIYDSPAPWTTTRQAVLSWSGTDALASGGQLQRHPRIVRLAVPNPADIPARFGTRSRYEPTAARCRVAGVPSPLRAEFFVAGLGRTPPVRQSTAPTACSRTCRPTTSRGRSARHPARPTSRRAGACSSPAPTPRLTAKAHRRNQIRFTVT